MKHVLVQILSSDGMLSGGGDRGVAVPHVPVVVISGPLGIVSSFAFWYFGGFFWPYLKDGHILGSPSGRVSISDVVLSSGK